MWAFDTEDREKEKPERAELALFLLSDLKRQWMVEEEHFGFVGNQPTALSWME